jgi:hypothetical protein
LDLQAANAAGDPIEATRIAVEKLALTHGKVIWDMNVFTEPNIPEVKESFRAMQTEFFRQVKRFKGTLYIVMPGDNTEAQAAQIFMDAAAKANANMSSVPEYVQFGSVAIASTRDILAMVKIPGQGKLLPMALR